MSDALLTVDQVSVRLHCSRAQAYLEVHKDGFPLIELGPRLLRVDSQQLERWIEQHQLGRWLEQKAA